VYAWRLNDSYQKLIRTPAGPERIRLQAEHDRMLKEADFSFKQAFAFCPYSPEAVFRYINVLFSQNRYPEALTIAKTCLKLDPQNLQVEGLVKQLETQLPGWEKQNAAIMGIQSNITFFENAVRTETNNFTNAFSLISSYLALGQTNLAENVLDGILANPNAPADAVLSAADAFIKLGNYTKLERALSKLVTLQPENPEAWFDLGAMMVNTGKKTEGLAALRKAIALSNTRLAANPAARNLIEAAKTDPRFNVVRQLPEFQQILAGQ
jgi:tetratricopeptide (TPR) repeat protein